MSREPSKHWSSHLITLLDQVLQFRYLRQLSEDEREELREHADFVHRTIADQRAPRVAVMGSDDVPIAELLETVTRGRPLETPEVKEYLGRGRWYDYKVRDDALKVLDLRAHDDGTPALQALERDEPDTVLLGWSPSDGDEALERLEHVIRTSHNKTGHAPSLVALIEEDSEQSSDRRRETKRQLRDYLRDASLPHVPLFVARRDNPRDLTAELVESTPMEARFQFAQIVGSPEPKRRLARMVIQSSAGLAAAFATLPLPVADIVPITTIQVVMIAAIGHLSGRGFHLRSVGEFLVAAGVNVGAGYALREIARALVQLVPFAGSAISSGIATGATIALGNAAVSYFIDGETPDPDLERDNLDATS